MGISLPFEAGLNPYVTPELAFEYHYFFTVHSRVPSSRIGARQGSLAARPCAAAHRAAILDAHAQTHARVRTHARTHTQTTRASKRESTSERTQHTAHRSSALAPALVVQRKYWMLYPCRALIVTPGGFGTMDELFELLTLKQTGKIKVDIPVVLFGKSYWQARADRHGPTGVPGMAGHAGRD